MQESKDHNVYVMGGEKLANQVIAVINDMEESKNTDTKTDGITYEDMKRKLKLLEKMRRFRKTYPVRSTPKVQRNEPCPCNSGKKFKNCCGK